MKTSYQTSKLSIYATMFNLNKLLGGQMVKQINRWIDLEMHRPQVDGQIQRCIYGQIYNIYRCMDGQMNNLNTCGSESCTADRPRKIGCLQLPSSDFFFFLRSIPISQRGDKTSSRLHTEFFLRKTLAVRSRQARAAAT